MSSNAVLTRSEYWAVMNAAKDRASWAETWFARDVLSWRRSSALTPGDTCESALDVFDIYTDGSYADYLECRFVVTELRENRDELIGGAS